MVSKRSSVTVTSLINMEPNKVVLPLVILVVCLGSLLGILLLRSGEKLRSKRAITLPQITEDNLDNDDVIPDASSLVDAGSTKFPDIVGNSSLDSSSTDDNNTFTSDMTREFIHNSVDTKHLDDYLKLLAQEPDLAGTSMDLIRAEWYREKFIEFGFDKVVIEPYRVLLSYPDNETSNNVSIVDESGNIKHHFEGVQPVLHSPEEEHPSLARNFNAYSATGVAQGKLVYVHYSRRTDYEEFEKRNISISGHIFLARYGKMFRGNIVKLAQEKGAIAVLLYADPSDYVLEGPENVYPQSGWLPEDGVQLGTLKEPLIGDPLTPHYPSIESAYRLQDESPAGLPKIPVQPISYKHAEKLLQHMQTNDMLPEWQGGLNSTYPLGPGFSEEGWTVRVDVKTSNQLATIHNVIGTIRGKEEPDRYVLVGNHRDTWLLGAVDAKSGSITFLETARVFGLLVREGWRPRRSIVFCSWGAEEYGLIGSVEWVQHFRRTLEAKAIAYINVDVAVNGFPGNLFLKLGGSPLIYDLLYESAQKIPNPNGTETEAGRLTLYDTWLINLPQDDGNRPQVQNLGTGTDHAAFFFHLGVTSADVMMNVKKVSYGYPLYHTLYETYHLVSQMVDPGFLYHKAVTQLILEITWRIADDKVIPYNVENYAIFIQESYQNVMGIYGPLLEKSGIHLNENYWQDAVKKFTLTAQCFQNNTMPQAQDESADTLFVRAVNDKLMMLERAFVSPRGLTGKENMDHIVFIPSSSDAYASTTFSAFTDLLQDLDSTSTENEAKKSHLEKELAKMTYHLMTATYALCDPIQEDCI